MMGSTGLKIWILISLLLMRGAVSAVAAEIEPKLTYVVQEHYLKSLPHPFAPLSPEETSTDWGKELRIGQGLASDFDLYRAVTALKRAQILAPEEASRKQEMEYTTLLAYYLGKRYHDIDHLFTRSTLDQAGPDFAPFHDLLVILYDTYNHLDNEKKAGQLLELIHYHYPETHATLLTHQAFLSGDLAHTSPSFLEAYTALAKSPEKAALFNALLPGLGYYFLGLTHTAITALLLNALFLASCVYFFRKRAWAAAVLFLSFEIGWYIGGIQGGTTQATNYNERTYEALANPLMNREGIFPIHLLRYGL